MKRRFRLTRRALNDLAAAQDWYHARDPKLADLLLIDVHETTNKIVEHPQRFPEIDVNTRGTLCRQFPYRLYYEVRDDVVVIKAIYHTSRDPGRWDDSDRQ
jgi:toxin ParE1/3/4